MSEQERADMLEDALRDAYEHEYPLDSDPAKWMRKAKRALLLSARAKLHTRLRKNHR